MFGIFNLPYRMVMTIFSITADCLPLTYRFLIHNYRFFTLVLISLFNRFLTLSYFFDHKIKIKQT